MGNSSILENKLRQNERIYQEACAVFGGVPHVFRFYDQSDEISIDLLTVENAPLPDVISYSTLGLNHYPRISPVSAPVPAEGSTSVSTGEHNPDTRHAEDPRSAPAASGEPHNCTPDKPLRIEIAGACRSQYENLPNLLSFCSFEIINARFFCRHGSVYKDIINTYIQGSPMKHVLFAETGGVWQQPLPRISLEDKTVLWLNAFPISDPELQFLETHHTSDLLDLFREHRVDPYHWNRASIL